MPVGNPKLIDLVGQTFGQLTVTSKGERIMRKSGWRNQWICACSCGQITTVPTDQLKSGKTKSCGCLRQLPYAKTHGLSNTPTYETWLAMRDRCNNPNNKAYINYGERGITVCERWNDYPNFLADMGEKPKGLTIDRRDNNLGYSPENCHWGTDEEQRNNKRTNRMLTLNGKTQSMRLWCNELHLNYSTVRARLNRGWSAEQALA